MKKILVTGGAGMVGSNLSFRLDQIGYEVHMVDNLSRGSIANLLNFFDKDFIDRRLKVVDLSNFDSCRAATESFDLVFHLADIVGGISYVFGNQYSVFEQNISINTNTLRAAVENSVDQYIYVGTACSYPQHLTAKGTQRFLLKESDAYPAQPESAYGWSKLMGEYELGLAQSEGLIAGTILRLHNVYGYPTEFLGDRSQVIPSLARKIIMNPKEDFVVWGTGEQRRSFVFVDDVVDALVLGIERGINEGPIQIGPSESTSIGEIARTLARISGKQLEPQFDTSKPEGDGDRVGDLSRAEKILGWEPKTSLEIGLSETYKWISSQVDQ